MRRLLRKFIPEPREIRRHAFLGHVFGKALFSPDLWHLSRGSVAGAASIGLFMAWAPVPFQMVLAAGVAIAVRCNLPVSVAMVWVSNPVTMTPMFLAAHELGEWVLDRPPEEFHFEPSLRWLFHELGEAWEPLLLGCLVMGLASALLGQLAVRLLWRAHVAASWRERRMKRRLGHGRGPAAPPLPTTTGARESRPPEG